MYCTPLFFLRESIYGRGRIQPRQLLKSLLLGVALMSFLGQDLYAQTESALRFDGTNDWIDIGSTTPAMPTGNSPWTAEAWVKTNQTNIGNFISWGTRATNQRAGIAVRGGKAAFIGQYNDVTGLGSSPAINDGEWHHVAVTYGGGASFDGQRNGVKIYVDGRQISAGGGARSPMNLVGQHFRIGNISQPSNGEYFRGDLDEVRIWNYARPVTEIIETKDKTLQGNEDGLIAYYNFNQDFTAATTTVPGAKTANNVAGTLKNMSPPVAAVSPPSLSTTSCNVQIGDNAFGGIVFYILQPGDPDYEAGKVKGLVASEEDLPGRYPYGCYGIEIPNLPTSNQVIKPGQLWYELPGLDIGEGSSNLQHILAAPCQTSGGVMTAAVACSQYGAGGFNDWYFPSIGESIKMYEQHAVINLDQTKSYLLSSTRSPHRDVYWTRPGGRVMLGMNDRRSNLYVRPIRKFTQVDNVAGTSTLSAELLPFGREGKPGTTDVKTDGTAKLEVMFAYFDGDPVPTLSPSTLWNTLTSNGDLTTKFQEQGLADITHNVSASTAWTKLDGAGTAYLTTGTNGNTWNYHKFFRDGYAKIPAPATAPVPPATQFDEYTIFVMITDKTAPVFSSVTSTATESEDDPGQLISSSVHASVGVFDGYDIADARGIRSNIVIAPNGDQDDYRLMMHEMGHNFGSPDLYPTEKTTVSLQGGGTEEKYAHEMGGFGMMGDMRAATGFLGWHRFRYGWLPENRTKLVREAGPQTYTLAKITDATASTNPKMIVIPDENHYAKQWVIEIAQDVKKRDEPAINTEGDRVIVYSVEEPAPTGKREIRLLFREPLSYHIDHNTTEWIEKVSFSEGQGFTQRENVPFTMQVLEKTANGFEICINIPRKLQGGQYPDDQTNGGYRLHFSSIGDVLVKEEPSGNFKWGARNNFFLSNQIDNTYIRLWQGNIQLVSKADQSVVDEIELDAPAGSVWYLTDEGKVQVKNPDGEVLWASHPANQTSPNGDFTLQFALDGNIQIRETANMAAYQWDLKSNRFTQSNSSGTYVALKDGNIQLISKDTQEMLEEIAVNAPAGSTWFITY
ncbi:MAG: LamG-like jellyroll fold domain-containing protein [Bacteroidota bacterium]